MSTLLRVDGIEVGYGDLTAVRDVSLEVREGEAVALIGANGAGKTTTLRAVSGLLLHPILSTRFLHSRLRAGCIDIENKSNVRNAIAGRKRIQTLDRLTI